MLRKIKKGKKYARPIFTTQPKQKIIGSFSGGESSACMTFILTKYDKDWYDVKYVFINTSREEERSLVFVDNIDKYYKLNLVWLECVVDARKNKGVGFRIVDFKSAKRNGEVFEEWIKKYGLHGVKNPGCTRDMKGGTCDAWAKSIGFSDAFRAIGFRSDEPKRVNLVLAKKKRQIYPLYNRGIDKRAVKAFCKVLPFKLGLLEYEGNCKLCFKKSLRKLLTDIKRNPEKCMFLLLMELRYSINKLTGEKMFMFRGKYTMADLIKMAYAGDFVEYTEPVYPDSDIFDFELDEQSDCSESCEVEF